jgi:membrane protein
MPTNLFAFRGLALKEIAKRTWEEMDEADIFGRAAQLAYYFFLALFPFLIAVIATLSVFGFADRGRELLFQFMSGALPPSAFEIINSTINGIIQASGPLKMSFGIVAALWSASAGIKAVMDTLNAVYRVKEDRSMVKQYTVAVGITLVIAILLTMAVLIVVFGATIIEALSLGNTIALLWKIVQWPLALGIVLLAFAVTYYLAPNLKKREWHWVTPGALMGVAGWIIISSGLRIYLHFFNSYSATYGTLGGVIVLLLWFYLTGIAVLSGAALNGALEGLSQPASSPALSRQEAENQEAQPAGDRPQEFAQSSLEQEIAAAGREMEIRHEQIDLEIEHLNRTGKRMANLVRTHPRLSVVVAIAAGVVALFVLPEGNFRGNWHSATGKNSTSQR